MVILLAFLVVSNFSVFVGVRPTRFAVLALHDWPVLLALKEQRVTERLARNHSIDGVRHKSYVAIPVSMRRPRSIAHCDALEASVANWAAANVDVKSVSFGVFSVSPPVVAGARFVDAD